MYSETGSKISNLTTGLGLTHMHFIESYYKTYFIVDQLINYQ